MSLDDFISWTAHATSTFQESVRQSLTLNILILVMKRAKLGSSRLQRFSCVLLYLQAEIISCFLFSASLLLHPFYCPNVSDG